MQPHRSALETPSGPQANPQLARVPAPGQPAPAEPAPPRLPRPPAPWGGAWARRGALRASVQRSPPLPPPRPRAPPPHGLPRLVYSGRSAPRPPHRSRDRAGPRDPAPAPRVRAPAGPRSPHRPSETEHAARRPPSARTRPARPSPHTQARSASAAPRPGQTGALARTRPHLPPHTALPTMSRSLRPHPGLWPLPARAARLPAGPPGPVRSSLRPPPPPPRTRHPVPRRRAAPRWPPPCSPLPRSTPLPRTLRNSEPRLAARVPHSPHNSPARPRTPPHAPNSSPPRSRGLCRRRPLCRRQCPGSPSPHLSPPSTNTGHLRRQLPGARRRRRQLPTSGSRLPTPSAVSQLLSGPDPPASRLPGSDWPEALSPPNPGWSPARTPPSTRLTRHLVSNYPRHSLPLLLPKVPQLGALQPRGQPPSPSPPPSLDSGLDLQVCQLIPCPPPSGSVLSAGRELTFGTGLRHGFQHRPLPSSRSGGPLPSRGSRCRLRCSVFPLPRSTEVSAWPRL